MADEKPSVHVSRRLKREDLIEGKPVVIDQTAICDLAGPVIILGDPGLGKSVLAQEIGRQAGFVYVRASSFVRNAKLERLTPNGECLVIDGLDEIASATVGDGVDAILRQLSKLGYPRFILSSREVDWRGAADRIKFEDDYDDTPTIFHLLAFDYDDATIFLRQSFPSVDAERVLTHLADRGLEEIYKNPLTLRLIGEVAIREEALPSSRAGLLDRACQLLVQEDNPRHQDDAHAHAEGERLLLAAGAYAATDLLCDIAGLFSGSKSNTPDGCIHVTSIAALEDAEAITSALRTRLFEAESSQCFRLMHRVIAEYLGAKWLAHRFQSGVSQQRLFSLFGRGLRVPTSLRGLHAWMAHFDATIAKRCIDADPYAVLRYGDAETISIDIAQQLLRALVALSDHDPYFRAEDWARHPAGGLMRVELKDDIHTLIAMPDQCSQLKMLLLEAMVGTELAAALEPDLRAMMFDAARHYGERSRAADALRVMDRINIPAETIEQLLARGEADDYRLAWELLQSLGLSTVSMDLVIRTLYAYIGLTVCDLDQNVDRRRQTYIAKDLIEALTSTELTELLDAARDYGEPALRYGNHRPIAQVADLVRLAALCALTLDPKMAAADIWRRLHWFHHDQGYDRKTTDKLTQWFVTHHAVRRAVQTYVVFDGGCTQISDAAYLFHTCGVAIFGLTEDDILALIEEFDCRRGEAAADLQMLEALVLLAPRRNGIASAICKAAAKIGAHSPAFMAKLDELSKPSVLEWEKKQTASRKKAEAKRTAIHQSFRDKIVQDLLKVAAGAPGLLTDPAKAYLGHFRDFDRKASPEMRVMAFLGKDLGERVLHGFMASLDRDDRPSATDIVKAHLDSEVFLAEFSLICGVAERLRRGLGIDDLAVEARESALMAWRRTTRSQNSGVTSLKPLEDAVLCDDDAIERFFRTSIEPQLEHKAAYVYDLHFLGDDPRWRPLAGRLSVEWLLRYPSLPPTVETELLGHATRHAGQAELRGLAREASKRTHRDYEMMLTWLALDFLVDFDATYDWLVEAGGDDRDFLWFIRDRVSGRRGDADQRLSIAQRQFIVERFSCAWPRTSRPEGGSIGNTNHWNATALIEDSGYAISADPSQDATAALEHLITVADPSYVDSLRHAMAQQLRIQSDSMFKPVSVEGLTAVVNSRLPTTIDDMRAFFGDRIIDVNNRMHSTATDMWEAYWDGEKPRDENFCRNRLVEHISGQLPEMIRFVPEMHMPKKKRADIAAISGGVGLPVEIKGQWHPEVWTAPVEQLAARYLRDWHAEGRGVYIVLWFGDAPGKNLPVHPDNLARPKTPNDLRAMLIDRLPENLRDVIDVYVVDVSRPAR